MTSPMTPDQADLVKTKVSIGQTCQVDCVRGWHDQVEIRLVVSLKWWKSHEWSCMVEQQSGRSHVQA